MRILEDHTRAYCEATTIHGFAYFVKAPRLVEKLFWVAVVISCGSYAGYIIASAVQDWTDNPTATFIRTFSKVLRAKKYVLLNLQD